MPNQAKRKKDKNNMENKTPIQFQATAEDAKIIKSAADERRQSIASFVYYNTLEAARAVLAEKKARR